MTYNFHQWAVAPSLYESDAGLKAFWDVTSQSRVPNNGTAFVATIEAKNYPIYATQFHPEKTSELWSNYDIDHFADKVPTDAKPVILGDEIRLGNPSSNNAVEPLFKNKAWLWAVMGLIIAVLGWFTLRMMAQKEE